jgi:hypothetical protein
MLTRRFRPRTYVRNAAGHLIVLFQPERGRWYWRRWAHSAGDRSRGPFASMGRCLADAADWLTVHGEALV